MPQPVENLDKLDEHLKTVVQALHGAVKQGIPHVREPQIVDKAIADCKEILDETFLVRLAQYKGHVDANITRHSRDFAEMVDLLGRGPCDDQLVELGWRGWQHLFDV